HMAQEVGHSQQTALDHVLDGDEDLRATEREIARAETEGDNDALAHAYAKLEAIDGYSASSRAQQLLHGLGFGIDDYQRPVKAFSGGWRIRLNLAQALMCPSDLLLLDEPTNHLDFDALLWLEENLQEFARPFVVVSHDRKFLDRSVSTVVEVAPYYESGLFWSEGNYQRFVEERKLHFERQASTISKLRNKHRNESEWVSRGPKARGTKANYRLKSFDLLEEELSRLKALIPAEAARTQFETTERRTKDLLEFDNVSFAYGDKKILHNQSFLLKNGACLGILGSNGQGKSTVLKLCMDELKPTAGKIKAAPGISIAYFDQVREQLNDAHTLKEELGDGSDHVIYQGASHHIVSWAKRFGFQPEDFDKRVANLSGGERARILLSRLVRISADVLILDEPTNDLDIAMLELLEAMIQDFPGAVILVSHDRYMLEKLCSKFLGFSKVGELNAFASYEQWEKERFVVVAKSSTQSPKKGLTSTAKLSQSERKELQKMERVIEKAETQLAELHAKAALPEVYSKPEEAVRVGSEIEALTTTISQLYERWELLESKRS
ncbi:MAG: ABC-F family ATP-binding cassette domain-containing protein, partial [Bdellovibrionales bacterium]|nr:ABC-F family ATP-binding cassette domain-containing protein [Bdellovibrionales bacterium]